MRCYTWKRGQLIDGLDVSDDKRLGPVVCLGEKGPGKWLTKIALFKRARANVTTLKNTQGEERRVIVDAEPKTITVRRGTKKEKSFVTLARSPKGRLGFLVRIITDWEYAKNTKGTIVPGDGCTIVAEGHGAYEDGEHVSTWTDSLVHLKRPKSWVRISPNGEKTADWAVWVDADRNLMATPWEDFESIQTTVADREITAEDEEFLEAIWEINQLAYVGDIWFEGAFEMVDEDKTNWIFKPFWTDSSEENMDTFLKRMAKLPDGDVELTIVDQQEVSVTIPASVVREGADSIYLDVDIYDVLHAARVLEGD